ncbi:hypothetical protein [Salibacter halophilus]|uniref:Uncharacterized protein n=1 Tax=Salibacter halophilus TaxID=1803916 RepID=A0A6N6M576_9FLAO|nr:hypothetical protein [Salibacter halophilus]KAB1064767.1 hypothetical protein F3059_05265 [Salibacter halophilus]
MEKEEYYNIGQELNLPKRCPILQYCCRRAWTIYFFSRYIEIDRHNNYALMLKNEGEVPEDFEIKSIEIQGEAPGGRLGNDYGWFHDVCPEVNLFDGMNAIGYFKGKACSEGVYDKENNPQAIIHETRHYSECLEYISSDVNNNQKQENQKDIFEFKPNIHGIGINFNELWRRFKNKK